MLHGKLSPQKQYIAGILATFEKHLKTRKKNSLDFRASRTIKMQNSKSSAKVMCSVMTIYLFFLPDTLNWFLYNLYTSNKHSSVVLLEDAIKVQKQQILHFAISVKMRIESLYGVQMLAKSQWIEYVLLQETNIC